MKNSLIALFLLVFVLTHSGCNDTGYKGHACIGWDDKENPNLEYDTDLWNITVGILLFGTVIVPVWVALDEAKCPIGPK